LEHPEWDVGWADGQLPEVYGLGGAAESGCVRVGGVGFAVLYQYSGESAAAGALSSQ